MVEKAWRRGRGVKNDAHNYKVLKSCSWMMRMKGYVDEKVEGGGVKNDVHNYKVLKPCSWMRRMKGLWMKRWGGGVKNGGHNYKVLKSLYP